MGDRRSKHMQTTLSMLPPENTAVDTDISIRLTDSDAATARLSAVQKQYLQDPYIKYFVPRAHLQTSKPPLINIGTFIRSTAIDDLVHRWLLLSEHEGKPCQIVSLGAGSDTRFWRIAVSAVCICQSPGRDLSYERDTR
jgi:[phosphatase 2A protein]-leucine-carboxy methyltransferase